MFFLADAIFGTNKSPKNQCELTLATRKIRDAATQIYSRKKLEFDRAKVKAV
jgi:hypothetical protein